MMKMKRILLVVTIGVSFAPPVFAETNLMDYRPNVAHVGQAGEDVSYAGAYCNKKDPAAKDSQIGSQDTNSVGTSGAAYGG